MLCGYYALVLEKRFISALVNDFPENSKLRICVQQKASFADMLLQRLDATAGFRMNSWVARGEVI